MRQFDKEDMNYSKCHNTVVKQKWVVQDVMLFKISDWTMVSIVVFDWLWKNPRHASGTFIITKRRYISQLTLHRPTVLMKFTMKFIGLCFMLAACINQGEFAYISLGHIAIFSQLNIFFFISIYTVYEPIMQVRRFQISSQLFYWVPKPLCV